MKRALVVVDMQRYYLDPSSVFCLWAERNHPGSMAYIAQRCTETVIPNIVLLAPAFRAEGSPVFFLRLCGCLADRSDLHRFFRDANAEAAAVGYPDMYPLSGDPFAEVDPRIVRSQGDIVCDKATFSGFSSGGFGEALRGTAVDTLVFTGLATSQCVETTARDASDRGYSVIMVEDACADYSERLHRMSLYVSSSVCGGDIRTSTGILPG